MSVIMKAVQTPVKRLGILASLGRYVQDRKACPRPTAFETLSYRPMSWNMIPTPFVGVDDTRMNGRIGRQRRGRLLSKLGLVLIHCRRFRMIHVYAVFLM